MDNAGGAKAVSVVERLEGTTVVENGRNATYDVYLRPCSDELLNSVLVTMNVSVSNQINLNTTELRGADFEQPLCKATVEVSAFDDDLLEGDHFATIQHTVSTIGGDPILLIDNSTLLAASVLVQVYDDDIGGVIIEEKDGLTALAEINEADQLLVNELNLSKFDSIALESNAEFYEDEYTLRLTKEPVGNVTIELSSIAVASDRPSLMTPTYRNFDERIQVYVNGMISDTIVFNSSNWDTPAVIRVSAIGEYE